MTETGHPKNPPAELGKLMKLARRREIECVLVWKFDRFVSVQDYIDTDSPMGKAMFTIIGAMAELESSLISERVRAGMQAAKEEGKHVGRPATPDEVTQKWTSPTKSG